MGGNTREQAFKSQVVAIDLREKKQRVIDEKLVKKRRKGMYIAMKNHDNFKMPESPKLIANERSILAAEYAIDCAIALISPEQIEGESNSMECVDIIDILKNELLPEIIRKL